MKKRELLKAAVITSPIILTLRSGIAFASCVGVGELRGKMDPSTDHCVVPDISDQCSGQRLEQFVEVPPEKTGVVYRCPNNAFVVSSNAFTSLTG